MIVGLVNFFWYGAFNSLVGRVLAQAWRHFGRHFYARFTNRLLEVQQWLLFQPFGPTHKLRPFMWSITARLNPFTGWVFPWFHLDGDALIRFDGRSNSYIYLELVHRKLLTIWSTTSGSELFPRFHWEIFDHILVGMLSFVRIFAAFVMTYFDALKASTIRLDRLPRVNVITALTDSSCSYRLSGRLSFLFDFTASFPFGEMQLHSLKYRVFMDFFMFVCPCFIWWLLPLPLLLSPCIAPT